MIILPVLYTFRRCPYAIRARFTISYSGIRYIHREILLKKRPKELYDISKKATIPVLQLENDCIIDQSLDIMRWAIVENDKDGWFKNNKVNQLEMISLNDNIFKIWLDKYKYHSRFPEESKNYYRNKCSVILNKYEEQFKKTRYLLSDKCSLADVAIFPFVKQFKYVDDLWFEDYYPKTNKWLNLFINSDNFQFIMKKYPIWSPNQDKELIINN